MRFLVGEVMFIDGYTDNSLQLLSCTVLLKLCSTYATVPCKPHRTDSRNLKACALTIQMQQF
jgi:hypothetical protein